MLEGEGEMIVARLNHQQDRESIHDPGDLIDLIGLIDLDEIEETIVRPMRVGTGTIDMINLEVIDQIDHDGTDQGREVTDHIDRDKTGQGLTDAKGPNQEIVIITIGGLVLIGGYQ